MTVYSKTKEALAASRLAPHKKLGQNFLVHKTTAQRIVDLGQICSDDIIVEVGVGLAALTSLIAKKSKKVVGIELDSGIVRYHKEQNILPDNVQIIHGDVLKTDFFMLKTLSEEAPLKIMANLPYSISNPFIFKLVEHMDLIDWCVVMLQKEVADRLTAESGTKDYGIPTILLGQAAKVTKLMTLKPAEFHPRPKIDSTVIKIDFTTPKIKFDNIKTRQIFTNIVRAAFSQRRKTLLNTLATSSLFDDIDKKTKKVDIQKWLEKIDISPKQRAENLNIEDFFELSKVIALDINQ